MNRPAATGSCEVFGAEYLEKVEGAPLFGGYYVEDASGGFVIGIDQIRTLERLLHPRSGAGSGNDPESSNAIYRYPLGG